MALNQKLYLVQRRNEIPDGQGGFTVEHENHCEEYGLVGLQTLNYRDRLDTDYELGHRPHGKRNCIGQFRIDADIQRGDKLIDVETSAEYFVLAANKASNVLELFLDSTQQGA